MKLRPFELGLVILFGVLGLLSLVLINLVKTETKPIDTLATHGVQIWGTLPSKAVDNALSKIKEKHEGYSKINYRYIPQNDFEATLDKAMIEQKGPDIVLLSQEHLVNLRPRIFPIPETTYPKRDFLTNYIDGAQIFSLSDGIYGLPVAVDPLVMYWNRTLLADAGFTYPPATWESLVNQYFPRLIELRADRSVVKSVVAMGGYDNVRNSFGVISALMLQGGTLGVRESGNKYQIQLNSSLSSGDPLQSAVDFYTRFGQSNNTLYSWNSSFQDDRLRFSGNQLAFYFGYASEGRVIQGENPNLNFDIAWFPQGEQASVKRTYGKFYAFSILRSAKDVSGAYKAIRMLASNQYADVIAQSAQMSSVNRSAVAAGSNDMFGRIAFESAPVTYAWLNPNFAQTNTVFSTMVVAINSNQTSARGATSDAVGRLRNLYNQ
jgi:ABC-type glycerol-3-phosphate transport system substrate-binding protein